MVGLTLVAALLAVTAPALAATGKTRPGQHTPTTLWSEFPVEEQADSQAPPVPRIERAKGSLRASLEPALATLTTDDSSTSVFTAPLLVLVAVLLSVTLWLSLVKLWRVPHGTPVRREPPPRQESPVIPLVVRSSENGSATPARKAAGGIRYRD